MKRMELPPVAQCELTSVRSDKAASADVAEFAHQGEAYRLTVPFKIAANTVETSDGPVTSSEANYVELGAWTLEQQVGNNWEQIEIVTPSEAMDSYHIASLWTTQIDSRLAAQRIEDDE